MIYFIPAWYQKDRWNEKEQIWYMRRTESEFDDTVKQIQLFNRNTDEAYQIMLLSYAPNFRHFLHRQGIFHAPYWSAFDAIQEVRTKRAMILSYRDIVWPEDVEFVYTPFAIIARVHGEKYAQIEFGEAGNPILIDLFDQNIICRRNAYDDRGFVSSTILYENGQAKYRDYLTETGKFKARYFFEDNHVEINPEEANYLLQVNGEERLVPFEKTYYSSMAAVLEEVVGQYISFTEMQDIFCIAMDHMHCEILSRALKERKTILSFYGNRYDLDMYSEGKAMITDAGYIIADSEEHMKQIQNQMGQTVKNIVDISPYDTRIDTGISDQLYVQNIMVPIDGMEEELFCGVIAQLANYIEKNVHARVHIFTRKAEYQWKNRVTDKVANALVTANKNPRLVGSNNVHVSENDLDNEEPVKQKFFVDQCVSELEVSKCMREQRIMLDFCSTPELYVQVMAVSMGIPQIALSENQFLVNEKNGLILSNLQELPQKMDVYLMSLRNWNAARMHAYKIGERYTTDVLVKRWKEVIESLG